LLLRRLLRLLLLRLLLRRRLLRLLRRRLALPLRWLLQQPAYVCLASATEVSLTHNDESTYR
jgi:hypothetical protein